MKITGAWSRLERVLLLQTDQTIHVSWFVPLFVAICAFALTWARVSFALPLLVVATAVDRYRFDFAGAGLRVEHFVFVGVLLSWFLSVRPSWRHLNHSGSDLLLIAYLAVALISSLLFSPQLVESLKFFGLMTFGVALYWFVCALGSTTPAFTRGVGTLIGVGIGASLFGIIAWLAYPLGVNLGVQMYALENFVTYSPFGTLFDSNTLGMYAMSATLLQVTLLLDSNYAKWRLWLGAGTLITLLAVALSLTRVAYIGLVFGMFLVLVSSPRRRWALAIGGAAVGLVILALVANSALAGGGAALGEFSLARLMTSRSIFFRLDAYTRAWNDFLASPLLGRGVNVFAQNYTSPSGTRDWISNFFLMTLHDTGIVGLALLLAWLLWLAYETWRALKSPRGNSRPLLLALSIAYLALFLTYQATTVFWLGFNWVYLGLLRSGATATNTYSNFEIQSKAREHETTGT